MSETRSPLAPLLLVLCLALLPAVAAGEEDADEALPAPEAAVVGEAVVETEAEEAAEAGVEEEAEPQEGASEAATVHEETGASEDELSPPDEELRSSALLFFQALITGVPEALVELAAYPFHLDGTVVPNRAELSRKLREAFRGTDMSRIPFYGMRIYPADRMIEAFGQPPARLEALDLDEAWIAVANLGGHGHIAVFRHQGGVWRAVAYSE